MQYIINSIALVLCATLCFSQNYKKKTAEQKARFYTDQMIEELQLDSTTSLKVYELNLVVSQQFDSLYATHPEKEDARKGAIAIYKKRDARLRNVLTTQQFLKFDDIQREKREKRRLEREQKAATEKDE